MIRIGIVGSVSAHAATYARLLNIDKVVGDRARVVAIWSSANAERTWEVARMSDIPIVADSLHQLADQVDAAMVLDRHGDLHAEHALPLLLDRKPVFIDTPLAIDLADCRRMLNAAGRTGTAITSLSPLAVAPATAQMACNRLGAVRLAQIAGPSDFSGPYGGSYFSATHLVELATVLLGERVAGLQAAQTGTTVAVNVVWENDALANLGFFDEPGSDFHASLFGTAGARSGEIALGDPAFARVLTMVVEMFETGRSPYSSRRLLLPVAVARAIEQSLSGCGEWVDVAEMLDREITALG